MVDNTNTLFLALVIPQEVSISKLLLWCKITGLFKFVQFTVSIIWMKMQKQALLCFLELNP